MCPVSDERKAEMSECNCMCDETPYCVMCGTDEDVRLVDSEDGYVHLCGTDLVAAIAEDDRREG